MRRPTRDQLLAGLQGATALAAIGALIVTLLLGPKLSHVERVEREVRREVVTLKLPPGVHATLHREGVMPGTPGRPHAHIPGGRPAPAWRGRPHQCPTRTIGCPRP